MTANITVFTQEIQNALLVSAKATRFRPDSSLYKKYKIEGGGLHKGDRKNDMQHIGSEGPKDSTNTGYAGKRKRDSLQTGSGAKTAMVWIKKDSTLTRRVIKIGLSDDTNVQVLSGLTTDDEVVTGAQQLTSGGKGSSGAARSPFMPQRRGGSSSGSRGGSGGGGTGGGRSR
jgi:HlyD family secretion protein